MCLLDEHFADTPLVEQNETKTIPPPRTYTLRFFIYTLAYTVRYVLGCDSDCQQSWAQLTAERVEKVLRVSRVSCE